MSLARFVFQACSFNHLVTGSSVSRAAGETPIPPTPSSIYARSESPGNLAARIASRSAGWACCGHARRRCGAFCWVTEQIPPRFGTEGSVVQIHSPRPFAITFAECSLPVHSVAPANSRRRTGCSALQTPSRSKNSASIYYLFRSTLDPGPGQRNHGFFFFVPPDCFVSPALESGRARHADRKAPVFQSPRTRVCWSRSDSSESHGHPRTDSSRASPLNLAESDTSARRFESVSPGRPARYVLSRFCSQAHKTDTLIMPEGTP